MAVTLGTGNEQSPITVNALLENPLLVPELLRKFFKDQFVADQILRPAGKATGGAVQFVVAGPVEPETTFGGVEVVAPLAEIPVVDPIVGAPDSATVAKRGLGLRISRELKDRNNVGAVMLGLQQIKNAHVRSLDAALMTIIHAASASQVVSVSTPWDAASGTTIKKDWQAGNAIVETLQDTGYDYVLDTLIINRRTRDDLVNAPEFQLLFTGNMAGENWQIDGLLPRKLWGKSVIVSPQVPADTAYGVQKNVVGGIADERGTPGQPIEVSDMYPEPAYEAQRWNVIRAPAAFVDNPGAVVRFSNVET